MKYFPKNNLLIWLNAVWFLIGILFLNWNPLTIIFAYVFESFVILVFALVCMFLVSLFGLENQKNFRELINKSFTTYEQKVLGKKATPFLFFLYHVFVIGMFGIIFSAFVYGQSVFLFNIISYDSNILDSPTKVVENYKYLFTQTDMREAFLGIIFIHLISFCLFLMNKDYLTSKLNLLFTKPFVRIFVQQITVIVGGFFFFAYNNNLILVAAVLILVKTIVETIYSRIFEEKTVKNY